MGIIESLKEFLMEINIFQRKLRVQKWKFQFILMKKLFRRKINHQIPSEEF